MTKRKSLLASERTSELAKLDLLPQRESQRRTDELLRRMLNSPPDPHVTKPKPKRRARK